MLYTPADVINRSLDSIGVGQLIGQLTDGTRESEAARRIYSPTLRQLLRTAHWGFARKQAALLLLGDATGSTLDPGTGTPISQMVEQPWTYCYGWPNDGVAARWLPWSSNSITGAIPPAQPVLPPNVTQTMGPLARLAPARFLVSTSDQFAAEVGQVDWDNIPDFGEGQGAINRRVILTDVQGATLVYTYLASEIEMWDSLFSEAMVAIMAARLALPLVVNPSASAKEQAMQRNAAIGLRNAQIAIAKDAIREARVASANEMGFPQSVAHTPDWISGRSSGGRWSSMDGPGYSWCGWEGMAFGDGSVF